MTHAHLSDFMSLLISAGREDGWMVAKEEVFSVLYCTNYLALCAGDESWRLTVREVSSSLSPLALRLFTGRQSCWPSKLFFSSL